jgi:hypothetical protein
MQSALALLGNARLAFRWSLSPPRSLGYSDTRHRLAIVRARRLIYENAAHEATEARNNRDPTLLDQTRAILNLSVSFLRLRGSTKRSGKKSMTRST